MQGDGVITPAVLLHITLETEKISILINIIEDIDTN